MNLAGRFIVIDGPDGGGKSTQIARLKQQIEDAGGAWTYAKDPGGTQIGDRIRHVLLDFDLAEMDPHCETLLFMASRAQLASEVIRPALAAQRTVLGDRFISATCAYQVAAGFPREKVIELGRLAVGETWPDLTIILDVPADVGLERAGRVPQKSKARSSGGPAGQMDMFGDAQADAMELRPLEFHARVREIFLQLPDFYPRPVEVIDATRDEATVTAAVEEVLCRAFP